MPVRAVAAVVTVAPPGVAITTYPLIAAVPVSLGAVHVIVATHVAGT